MSSITSVITIGISVWNSGMQETSRIPSGILVFLETLLPLRVWASSRKCPSSTAIVTSSPARMREDTLAMPSLFTVCSAFRLANRSTAKQWFKSVAVVMTGVLPMRSAREPASSLAPPTCPDRTGITKHPCSSITSTGTSFNLSVRNGAMARTAIPQAPIKRRLLRFFICSPVHSVSGCST